MHLYFAPKVGTIKKKIKSYLLLGYNTNISFMLTNYLLQLPTSLICDATFCPRDSNIIAIAGKEYLSWWQINIEKGTLELIITPDYQVGK